MADAVVLTLMGEGLSQLLHDQTLYIGVGSGLASWDTASPRPQPTTAQISLYNEVARAQAVLSYLDSTGRVIAGPSRYLQCVASFGLGVANGTLREMGLYVFGSGTLASGKLIAAANFAAISKPAGGGDFTLNRTIRLTFLG